MRYVSRMADTIRSRIERRLAELNLSNRKASQLAGGSESLIQNVLNGKSANPRGDTVRKLAAALQVSEQWLLTGEDSPSLSPLPVVAPEIRVADVPYPELGRLPKDVPVMGTVAGSELGHGAFQLTTDVVDFVRRPAGLLGAKDVYALYV